jgi:hypothetical protein
MMYAPSPLLRSRFFSSVAGKIRLLSHYIHEYLELRICLSTNLQFPPSWPQQRGEFVVLVSHYSLSFTGSFRRTQ